MTKALFLSGIFTVLSLTACVGNFSILGEGFTSRTPDASPDPSPVPEPEVEVACTPSKTLKQFAIYYGWPSGLNQTTYNINLTLIIADFAQYESVIFGAGLEDSGHGDHVNTTNIVAAIAPTTKAFGYVAVGRTNNYSMATLKTKVDEWAAMTGLYGIFLDEFGFDFAAVAVTDAQYRARQKEIVDYVHSKGLKVFLNAFDPDDVFVKESTNPLTIMNGDRYLYESYMLSWSTRETFPAFRSKVAKLKQAVSSHPGLEIYVNSTKGANIPTPSEIEVEIGVLSASAIADGFTGVAWTEELFSAGAGGVMPKQNLPAFATTPYCVNGNVTENTGNETLNFSSSIGAVQLNYNAAGIPSFTIQ